MTINRTILQDIRFKTERDIVLVNILSALLIAVIAFFPNSPARIILGLPFILFFPGYVLICALFPRRKDLDGVERLTLSFGLSIAVTSLIGLALNYTLFGIRLYPVTFSLFLFMLLTSAVAMYRRRTFTKKEVFAPLASISISGWRERVKREFIKSYEWNRIIKIIVIICFILITIALVVSWDSPATGYEASIYNSTPPLLWFSLILSIACGITIIVHQIYNREYKKHNLWIIGLLSEEKGILNLVKAIPEILEKEKEIEFLVGGDGQLRDKIEEYLAHKNLNEKVKLLGWIPHVELPDYLNELKLVVLPSYTEGLPNIMLEAMACGTPVLATHIGGIPDVIRDGETGFIMENNSPECIAENVIRALNDSNLDIIVKNARKHIEDEYSYEATVKRYRKILGAFEELKNGKIL